MVRVLKVLAKNFYLWCLSESFKERPDGEGTERYAIPQACQAHTSVSRNDPMVRVLKVWETLLQTAHSRVSRNPPMVWVLKVRVLSRQAKRDHVSRNPRW